MNIVLNEKYLFENHYIVVKRQGEGYRFVILDNHNRKVGADPGPYNSAESAFEAARMTVDVGLNNPLVPVV